MEIQWTGKAMSDLARLYEFLAPVNQPAAVKVVRSLTSGATRLVDNPALVSRCINLTREMFGGFRSVITKFDMKFRAAPFSSCGSGTPVRIAEPGHESQAL